MKYHLLPYFLNNSSEPRIGLHPRRVADAEDIPMAIRSGHGVGMTAGHDVQDAGFGRDVADGERHGRVDVAEEEIDLVAVDQLMRLLHRRAGVGAGGILGQELTWRPRMPPFLLISSTANWQPIRSFLPSSA